MDEAHKNRLAELKKKAKESKLDDTEKAELKAIEAHQAQVEGGEENPKTTKSNPAKDNKGQTGRKEE